MRLFCIGVNTSDVSLICLFRSCFCAFLSDRYTVRNILITDGANSSCNKHLRNTSIDTHFSSDVDINYWRPSIIKLCTPWLIQIAHFPHGIVQIWCIHKRFELMHNWRFELWQGLGCLRTKRELNIHPLFKKGMYLTYLVHKMTSFSSKDRWWSHSKV